MSDPRFSVVIPTYNQADYLALAIRSVLEQTLQDLEVVVVNNGSTDHTADVLERFGKEDERISSLDTPRNSLIGASRNSGIEASRGRYIAFLDSDDLWHPRKLERVDEVLRNDSNARIVCHDEESIRDGKVVKRLRYGPGGKRGVSLYEYLLLETNCMSTSATVVERQLLESVGCFSEHPDFTTGEDYELWVRLSQVSDVYFLHEVLGQYRLHPSSTIATTSFHWQHTLNVLQKHLPALEASQDAGVAARVRRRYASVWLTAARGYASQGELGHGLRYLFKALRGSPLFWKLYPGLILLLLGWARHPRTRSG